MSSAKAAPLTTPNKQQSQSPSLASFIEATPSARHLRIEADLGNGFVRLRVDEAERRQAIQDIRSSEDILVELLRNSRDAEAHQIFVALSREGNRRHIVLIDDGCGIPPAAHELVFEPRVTSKLDTMRMDTWGVHGRGMALYSISQNALKARICSSNTALGTAVSVLTDTDQLGERKDQSSFPSFIASEEGMVRIRGPRNLLRTACEFALENRRAVSVYLGSPAEIAATLYSFACAIVAPSMRAFAADTDHIPVCKQLAFAFDEADFVARAANLGLSLSNRTARRILNGTIASTPPLLERIEHEGFVIDTTKKAANIKRQATTVQSEQNSRPERRPRIDAHDVATFAQRAAVAFEELAEAYYLDRDVEVSARIEGDRLVVSVPLRRQDQS